MRKPRKTDEDLLCGAVAATFERLPDPSPEFDELLERLKAAHSSVSQETREAPDARQ